MVTQHKVLSEFLHKAPTALKDIPTLLILHRIFNALNLQALEIQTGQSRTITTVL